MYVGAMAMVVFLILVQFQSREGLPCTFPPLLRVELGVLGLSWDFWAKSVSELQLEVEQIQLDAIGDGCSDRWRVCRWPDSTEQAVTWLMGIFILLPPRGRGWRAVLRRRPRAAAALLGQLKLRTMNIASELR